MTHQTQRTLRVLLLEDGAVADRVRQNLCGAGLAVTLLRVDTRAAFERALGEFTPDVVIADAGLEQVEPGLALDLARARSPSLPVIFLESELRHGAARELYRAGAADSLARDGLWRVGAAVRSALARVAAARERQLAAAAGEHLRLMAQRFTRVAA
jgi:DNA-binding NtrC family response regulator